MYESLRVVTGGRHGPTGGQLGLRYGFPVAVGLVEPAEPVEPVEPAEPAEPAGIVVREYAEAGTAALRDTEGVAQGLGRA